MHPDYFEQLRPRRAPRAFATFRLATIYLPHCLLLKWNKSSADNLTHYGVSNHGFDGILFLNDQLRYCNDLVSAYDLALCRSVNKIHSSSVLVDTAAPARLCAGLGLEGAGGARHARAAVRAGVPRVAEARGDVDLPRPVVRGVRRARHARAGVVDVRERVGRTRLALPRLRRGQAREARHAHAVRVPARARRDRLARVHAEREMMLFIST
jgi:hypothetical protein